MSPLSDDRGAFKPSGYDVLFELASGGMATVLLARQVGDAGFERLVALKRVHRHLLSDPEIFSMASDEARLAALIRHPGVVSVIGVLDTQGELVLVQEYVEGSSLSALLKRVAKSGRRLEVPICVKIVRDALRGLHAAHEVSDLRGDKLGLVHRDVSPQNLLVGSDGHTRVIDFGIAHVENRMARTRTGVVKGKLRYMAPEQLEERPLDRRADIFAMGAVLYEMLTGNPPFGTGDDAAVVSRILLGGADMDPVRASAPALADLIASALCRDPDGRPATALAMARELGRASPSADEEDVKALLESEIGVELADTRARIAASIGREDETAHDQREDEAPAPAIEPARPRSRLGFGAVAMGVGSVGLIALVVVLGRARDPESTDAGVAAGFSVSASAQSLPASSIVSMVPSAPPASVPSTGLALTAAASPMSATPSPSSRPKATSLEPSVVRPSASPSAGPNGSSSSELMPSPYRP